MSLSTLICTNVKIRFKYICNDDNSTGRIEYRKNQRIILLLLSSLQVYVQESRAVARTPRDAAAVVFGLKFADNIHYKYIRVAKLQKPGFRAPNVPAQNRI